MCNLQTQTRKKARSIVIKESSRKHRKDSKDGRKINRNTEETVRSEEQAEESRGRDREAKKGR